MSNPTRITINEYKQHKYKKLYDFLFIEPYINMSNDSKILYSLLRDRFQLSEKNKWINEAGEIYLIYKNKDLMKMMQRSEPSIIKMKKELIKYGLLEEERQKAQNNCNLPNLLFLKAENEFIIDDNIDDIVDEKALNKPLNNLSIPTKEILVPHLNNLSTPLKNFKSSKTYINHTNYNQSFNQVDDEIVKQFKFYPDGSVKQYLDNTEVDKVFQQFLNTRSKKLSYAEIIASIDLLENYNSFIQMEMIYDAINNQRRTILKPDIPNTNIMIEWLIEKIYKFKIGVE